MKKLYILLAFATIITVSKAQTIFNAYNNAAHSKNLLKGFDEKAVLAEFRKQGYPEKEFAERLAGAKALYKLKMQGIEIVPTFSNRSPTAGPCDNSGFEDTTFTNWTGATGLCSTLPTTWTPGFVTLGLNAAAGSTSQMTLLDTAAFDPYAINATTLLPEIPLPAPGGGGVSLRLGNENVGAQTEKVDYLIHVDSFNNIFTYRFAAVLEDPGAGHTTAQLPRFDVRILDSTGTVLSGPCGTYSVTTNLAATDPTFHAFQTYTDGIGGFTHNGYYRKWTTVAVDLSPFIGHPVTFEFQTSDCTLTGHFGYAYVDATCAPLIASVQFCPLDTSLLLIAPVGFSVYQWYDPLGMPVSAGAGGTNDSLWINSPVLGQIYTVAMQSISGCGSTVAVTLTHTNMTIASYGINSTYNTTSDGMAYVTTSGASGPFTYTWTDSTGAIVGNNDSLMNLAPGKYVIHVTNSGGCDAIDTVTIGYNINNVGITKYNYQDAITIYPNPATNQLTVNSGLSTIKKIKIYNLLGEVVSVSSPNNNQATINISQYSKGIYFVQILTDKGIVNRKIVKE